MKINQDLYNGLRIQGPVEYDSKNNVPIKRIRHLVRYICCMEQKYPLKTNKTLGQVYPGA